MPKTTKGLAPIPSPYSFTILIDTREPLFRAYDFTAYGNPDTRRVKLSEGDYSVEGLTSIVGVERKTLDDFAASVKADRFWDELDRAKPYPRFAVIIEGSMADAEAGLYSSQIAPKAVPAAANSISAKYGFPVIWAGNRQSAALWTYEYLRRIWEARAEFLPKEKE